jgi:hypothetical protein
MKAGCVVLIADIIRNLYQEMGLIRLLYCKKWLSLKDGGKGDP